jgi:hypothetical protein
VVEEWHRGAGTDVCEGCKLRFIQSPNRYDALVATKRAYPLGALPGDRIGGMGLSEQEDRILDYKNWRGINWMGQILTGCKMI